MNGSIAGQIFILLLMLGLNCQAAVSSAKALHLLNRMTYGPKPGDVRRLAATGDEGLRQFIERQLNAGEFKQEPKIEKKLKSFLTLNYTNQQMLSQHFDEKLNMSDSESRGKPEIILKELMLQKLVRAVESENQFAEVILDFWFNHFSVNFSFDTTRFFVTSYERDAIKPHVFGYFKDLLMATAKSPAMMQYLSNVRSVNGHIIENYSRELLELHTVGIGAKYSQNEVEEVARIFTGWSVEKWPRTGKFRFYPENHDPGSKTALNLDFPANEGINEGERLINYLAADSRTAEHISKKLAVRFISDNPSAEIVSHLTKIFIDTHGNLKEVYKALFTSEEFWNEKNFNSKIKTPFEFVVSSARALDIDVRTGRPGFDMLMDFLEQSGQPVYRCVPPIGFEDKAEVWISASGAVNRINYSKLLTGNKIPLIPFKASPLSRPASIDSINEMVFNSAITPKSVQKIKELQVAEKFSVRDQRVLALMLATIDFQRR